jgi:hypothetical protein
LKLKSVVAMARIGPEILTPPASGLTEISNDRRAGVIIGIVGLLLMIGLGVATTQKRKAGSPAKVICCRRRPAHGLRMSPRSVGSEIFDPTIIRS